MSEVSNRSNRFFAKYKTCKNSELEKCFQFLKEPFMLIKTLTVVTNFLVTLLFSFLDLKFFLKKFQFSKCCSSFKTFLPQKYLQFPQNVFRILQNKFKFGSLPPNHHLKFFAHAYLPNFAIVLQKLQARNFDIGFE